MWDTIVGFIAGVGVGMPLGLLLWAVLDADWARRHRNRQGHGRHPAARWEWGDFPLGGFPVERGDIITPESILAIMRWELDRRARPIPTGKEDSDLEEPSHRA